MGSLNRPEIDQLRQYCDFGIKTIRLRGKVPFEECWPERGTADINELMRLHREGMFNVGVLTGETNGIAVLDIDKKDVARAVYSQHRKIFEEAKVPIVETTRGIHLPFRMPEKNWPTSKFFWNGEEAGDLKADGGQVCWPISRIGQHVRRFLEGRGLLPKEKLLVLDPAWLGLPETRSITREEVRSAVRYIMEIESIAGKQGSKGLVRACAILRDSGLSEAEAMVHLIAWNESGKASPPWSLRELARALKNTYAKGKVR